MFSSLCIGWRICVCVCVYLSTKTREWDTATHMNVLRNKGVGLYATRAELNVMIALRVDPISDDGNCRHEASSFYQFRQRWCTRWAVLLPVWQNLCEMRMIVLSWFVFLLWPGPMIHKRTDIIGLNVFHCLQFAKGCAIFRTISPRSISIPESGRRHRHNEVVVLFFWIFHDIVTKVLLRDYSK